MEIKYLPITHKQNAAGSLFAVEGINDIPFAIARVYYILDMPIAARRGKHAHIKISQAALCIRGACKFLLDDGKEKAEVILDNPSLGIMLEPMIWHEMYDFSKDCIIVILADAHYDEQDYIRDYTEFLHKAQK